MAKIIGKLPTRKRGKYFDTGYNAEEILSKIYSADDLLTCIQKTKDLTDGTGDSPKDKLINDLLYCITVSFYNLNGLNVVQNADKTGLTENFTEQQKILLKHISQNTSLARILFSAGKYSVYAMFIQTIMTFYVKSNMKGIYNIINPKDIYVFICFAMVAFVGILSQESLANNITKKIQKMINQNTL